MRPLQRSHVMKQFLETERGATRHCEHPHRLVRSAVGGLASSPPLCLQIRFLPAATSPALNIPSLIVAIVATITSAAVHACPPPSVSSQRPPASFKILSAARMRLHG